MPLGDPAPENQRREEGSARRAAEGAARRPGRFRRRALRRAWPLFAAVALLGILVGAWLGIRGLAARRHLDDARAQLTAVETTLRSDQLGLRDPELDRRVAAAAADTRAARRLTADPLWRLAAAVPAAGCPFRSSADLAKAADRITQTVVRPLVAAAPALAPRTSGSGVSIDVAAVRRAAPQVVTAAEALAAVRQSLAGSSACGALGRRTGLATARAELLTKVTRLQGSADALAAASTVLPGMLGADGPRRYLLIVQNTAESRATGGILGAVGVLNATDGALSLGAVRGNSAVPPLPAGFTLPLPADVQTRYLRNGLTNYWQDANLTPDFPTAARIYQGMWQAGAGQRVDGVLAVDPTMLSYLLSATGPARMPDGTEVDSRGLVPLLESRIYAQLPTNALRDSYFAAAGASIYQHVLTGSASPTRLLPALGKAAGEGRLLVWSSNAAEQRKLADTPLGGALPTARGPFLSVVTQNAASGKLDYYLHRQTDYQARALPDGTGEAVATVALTNSAPRSGLTPYVLAHDDAGHPILTHQGRNVLYVSVFAGVDATFDRATLDGQPVDLESESERGHSVFSTHLTIDAGQTRTLRIWLAEPDWRPTLVVRPQPLVNPERLVVHGIRVQGR